MPAHDVQPTLATEVTRAQQLAVIPVTTAFVLALLFREGMHAFREMAAEDDGGGPDITSQVRQEVAGNYLGRKGARQQGEYHIILGQLLRGLLPEWDQDRLELFAQALFTRADFFPLHFMHGHAPLE